MLQRTVSLDSSSCNFFPTSLLVHSSVLSLDELLLIPGTTRGMAAAGCVCVYVWCL